MKRIAIFGAGVAGQDILKEINQDDDMNYDVLGFLDDNIQIWGKKIINTLVLGGRSKISELRKSKKLDEVIIAIPSADGEQISEIEKLCSQVKVGFRIVPRVKEIIEGRAHLQTLREVKVEDLLGRPVVKADVEELKDFFTGKTVLVTGAAGSIGSELSRQISAYSPEKICFFDWWENGLFELQTEMRRDFPKLKAEYIIGNMQDKLKVDREMKRIQPDYVYHAAAYKHVPLMEDHPDEAVKNNVFGTLNFIKAAVINRVEKFVLVSTDKAANPINAMGITKLITEGLAKIYNGKTKFMAVRFGNVLDSFGSVIPTFRKQILQGGPVTITDKRMTRYFMTIPEAAQLIIKAGVIGNGGELFVLDMGKPVKIIDLANNMIRLSGFIPNKDIKIIYTGVRKGEKISEKLFIDKESVMTHKEGKIFVTKSMGLDINKLQSRLSKLKDLATSGQKTDLVRELKSLI